MAALVDLEVEQVGILDAKTLDDGWTQRIVGVVQRKAEFSESEHGVGCLSPALSDECEVIRTNARRGKAKTSADP
jgi:hypothetical protein